MIDIGTHQIIEVAEFAINLIGEFSVGHPIDFALRTLLDDTLVSRVPIAAVTFVDNHDTQPGQALASFIMDWFKPIAYAFILLRGAGYPCVFFGDYFGNDGAEGEDKKLISHRVVIDAMLAARAQYLHGEQKDYFEQSTCVGWLLTGNEEHPGVMAVVASTAHAQAITMATGRPGLTFKDITGAHHDTITTDEQGNAAFQAQAGGVSVWCSV